MKIRSKRMLRLLARSMAAGCRLLFKTVRSELIETCAGTSPYDGNRKQRFLYCIWHDNILGPTFCGRSVKMAALTSLHGDGAFVAMALECVGITPIRGSSSRGGAAALREMMDAARDMDITIATDGPRGPRREVKQGIVYLASQTGRPIVPVAIAATRAWHIPGRWTDLLVPKPFSKVWLIAGEPISIPGDLTRDELKSYRDEIQLAMDQWNRRVSELANGSGSQLAVSSRVTDESETTRRAA
ncbi:MAG: lysophospholipid acyltransferase family protein [Planctomycetaceae bacterium]|nr:lysophospholipid acyltransferase family protein [Planctomycetaceae bacterium]